MAVNKFQEIYTALFQHYGPQKWWPAETPLEMIVGAVLTQNTNWKNVDMALNNLKEANLLTLDSLNALTLEELAEYIRPAGYYNLKAKRLKNLLRMICEEYDGDLQRLSDEDLYRTRSQLLKVNGIGEETADSILLYAAEKPIFVVDTYTYRVFSRHHLLEEECSYADIQERFMDNLTADAVLFNEYHALIVKVAKEYCKKKQPLCHMCPLEEFL
jgi:endonuclease III related protein